MLKTPFGNIRMFLDKKEVEFNFSKIQNSKSFLKTETYSLKYEFKKEKVDKTSKHFLKCILETNFEYEAYVETGERLEAISFEINKGKLTIGTVSGLSMVEVDGNNNDFDVKYLKNGIEMLTEEIEKMDKEGIKKLSADASFKLYDTFGLPFELTELILENQGYEVSEEEFNQKLEEQVKLLDYKQAQLTKKIAEMNGIGG